MSGVQGDAVRGKSVNHLGAGGRPFRPATAARQCEAAAARPGPARPATATWDSGQRETEWQPEGRGRGVQSPLKQRTHAHTRREPGSPRVERVVDKDRRG